MWAVHIGFGPSLSDSGRYAAFPIFMLRLDLERLGVPGESLWSAFRHGSFLRFGANLDSIELIDQLFVVLGELSSDDAWISGDR
jgi:hypothetical protein